MTKAANNGNSLPYDSTQIAVESFHRILPVTAVAFLDHTISMSSTADHGYRNQMLFL